MKEATTNSWIFMAIAMASKTSAAKFNEITMIADGINHAVPTQKEMRTSIVWLSNKGLVTKIGKKYSLTPKGKSEYETASENVKTVLAVWGSLENNFEKYT